MQTSYQAARDAIVRQFSTQSLIRSDQQLYGQFILAGAALSNYLPDIDAALHPSIFCRILMHRKLSLLEQWHEEALGYVHAEGFSIALHQQLLTSPAIICTFHTGSYRILNLFLLHHGISFTLVASKEVIDEEGALLHQLYRKLTGKNDFTIIDAASPRCIIHLARELKAGRSIVIYPDGNTGSGTLTRHNANTRVIPFLSGKIHAREGIGRLAELSGVPVLPVISSRTGDESIQLNFGPILSATRQPGQKDILNQLFAMLASMASASPDQWEGWLYLHRSACISDLTDRPCTTATNVEGIATGHLCFNSNSFALFSMGKKHFLLRKSSYTFFQIDQYLLHLLTLSEQQPVKAGHGNKSLIRSLAEDNILINFNENYNPSNVYASGRTPHRAGHCPDALPCVDRLHYTDLPGEPDY